MSNEKEVHWLDTGYNIWPSPLTSLMTLTLGVSRSDFEIALSPELLVWLNVKWKGRELIWFWADCMTLPFDHTHDLDLGVLRSESEIILTQEWGGRLTMNEKDVSHPFMTMILTCVTMVMWADVPDSDGSEFRRRRAVDISSLLLAKVEKFRNSTHKFLLTFDNVFYSNQQLPASDQPYKSTWIPRQYEL